MTTISGITDLLGDTSLSREQRDFVDLLRSSSAWLLTIINDILDYSKIEAGKLELESDAVRVESFAEEVLSLVGASKLGKRPINLCMKIAPGTPQVVFTDAMRLQQILLNLLGNAIKFTQRGDITLRISAQANAPGADGRPRQTFLFAVEDPGIGIPSDRIGSLFKSFSQVDTSTTRKYGGTGLGLAISKRLAEMLGGKIWVESEEGRGSTFSFTIVGAIGEAADVPPPSAPSLVGKRVLLVERSPAAAEMVTSFCVGLGMVPIHCEGAAAGLELLSGGAEVDIAVVDTLVPDRQQAALRDELHRHDLPTLLLSPLDTRVAAAFDPLGEILVKPLRRGSLLKALERGCNADWKRARETAEAAGQAPTREASLFDPELAKRNPLFILVAEDNATNNLLLIQTLARFGYRADSAFTGAEAVELATERSYDVILMDVQMPELDGIQATRAIRESSIDQPRIIAITANAMAVDREACLEAGMDDFVGKPIELAELRGALERAQVIDAIGAREPVSAESSLHEVIWGAAALERETEESYQKLTSIVGSEIADEIINLFLAEGDELMAGLRFALEAGEDGEAAKIAHSFKSSAGGLHLHQLITLAAAIEARSSEGDQPRALALLLDLERRFAAVYDALSLRDLR